MLAAIPCGVQTGAGAILNTFKVRPGDSLAVFGAGAVGLSAVMAGHLVGALPLIALDVVDERLDMAIELGATHALNTKDGNVAARIQEIAPKGVQFSLETTSNEQAFKDSIDCLSMGGICGIVTAPHSNREIPFTPQIFMKRACSLQGIIQGSSIPSIFLPRIIALNKEGRFPYDRLIKTYEFSDINKAFEDSRSGKTIKPVLIMS
jgi:aryl-alcohol dehydrogenase